ncbi:PepSY-like domain-containing protein [Flavobacterium sp. ALJ2]|uniref:PepSY-like domain-containing protein n=1 Tax=Flavobacterium sp. ALJ2 TaxID=2786960 RepID=UPI00189EAAB1|nr:PepSY-like domain-containing protein [Flavobacterium sp. ALJ2]MBF7091552.1 PepSY-like domain-containing protein [Flavobacterium sp. ALJ2]
MRTTIISLFGILISTFAMAQDLNQKDVPGIVKSTFLIKFPDVTNAKWEKEKDNYEVSFIHDKQPQLALLDSSGNLIQTEIKITKDQLPNSILPYVKVNYRRKKIREVAKITDVNGKIFFEVEIYKKDLIFDYKGNFVKEISK